MDGIYLRTADAGLAHPNFSLQQSKRRKTTDTDNNQQQASLTCLTLRYKQRHQIISWWQSNRQNF